MNKIENLYIDFAKTINEEIEKEPNTWFQPKGPVTGGPGPGDFDYGQMKFINKNLNYFYYENMIVHALINNYEFNPHFPKALQFCEYLRTILNESGPFGRMCVWKLEPKGYLAPHRDNWQYHRNITRYIFCVSDSKTDEIEIKINSKYIKVKQGLLFKFYPAIELHSFANNSDENFYFLGFDYWDSRKLNYAAQVNNLNKESILYYEEGYGGHNKKTKYMSAH